MTKQRTDDINVEAMTPLIAPKQLKAELPLSDAATQTVLQAREDIKQILAGDDPRVMVIVGPCSIHDEKAALDYARKLRALADEVRDKMLLVMRVYFEKPRTTIGWKGLINDPHLDGTFDINAGLRAARRILIETNELGLPAATELLEPITPQYIADLLSEAAIGARTTESPTHRQMVSGLSMPVGLKNGTDGSLQVALDAMTASKTPHAFLGIDEDGNTCVIQTRGNPWGHLILRGGRSGPNFSADSLKSAEERLTEAGLSPRLLVDCSHANSDKDFRKQPVVWHDVISQRVAGNRSIIGLMVESNLNEGKQNADNGAENLAYGVSITDGCLSFDATRDMILEGHRML